MEQIVLGGKLTCMYRYHGAVKKGETKILVNCNQVTKKRMSIPRSPLHKTSNRKWFDFNPYPGYRSGHPMFMFIHFFIVPNNNYNLYYS